MAKRKAEELESFTAATPGGPAAKRRRADEDGDGDGAAQVDGAKIMLRFLADFAELPLDKLSDEEALARVRALRGAAEAEGNPFVLGILAQEGL